MQQKNIYYVLCTTILIAVSSGKPNVEDYPFKYSSDVDLHPTSPRGWKNLR